MFILNHYINTVTPRTYYSLAMSIRGRRGPAADTHFIPTDEYKTAERAVKFGLRWLVDAEANDAVADFRLIKIRVYPDGSVRFWDQNEWHATRTYMREYDYSDEMVERGVTRRSERMVELGLTPAQEVAA